LFFDVACGFLEFAVYSMCPLSARYFLRPAKGGSLPLPALTCRPIMYLVEIPNVQDGFYEVVRLFHSCISCIFCLR
jgi:hypothetical protein